MQAASKAGQPHVRVQRDDVHARQVDRKVAALGHKVGLVLEVAAGVATASNGSAGSSGCSDWVAMRQSVGTAAGWAKGPRPHQAAMRLCPPSLCSRGRGCGGVQVVEVVHPVAGAGHQLVRIRVLQQGPARQLLNNAAALSPYIVPWPPVLTARWLGMASRAPTRACLPGAWGISHSPL